MDSFIERLVEWFLKTRESVYDKETVFYVEENTNTKIPFHYVENIVNNYMGEKEQAEMIGDLHSRECLFNDLLIKALREKEERDGRG